MRAYISGHLKITKEEFMEHYSGPINLAILNNHTFIVCDAKGTDTMAQEYLLKIMGEEAKSRVTVYHMFDTPRNNVGFKTVGGFKSDEERDTVCTYASDYDLAWVRPGRTGSGTEKNILRRKQEAL